MHPIQLRPEHPADHRAVEELTRDAFWNFYSPGCVEHYLTHILRSSPDFVEGLDYVAVRGDTVVGSILYTRANILLDNGGKQEVLCFGPLAVAPAVQRQGIGRQLINQTAQLARELGYAAILIYGDPDYYSRQGFVPAERFAIGSAEGAYIDSLQAMELRPGALAGCAGLFQESPSYQVDPDEVLRFDAAFPPKEQRSGLPSQERFAQLINQTKPRQIPGGR